MEGSFKYNWREFLHVGGSLTYQNITDQADSVYNESIGNTGMQRNWLKGFRLPNTPYLFGNATVGLTAKDLLTLESAWSLKNGKYNVSAECRNLLDARLYDQYFLQKPGRAFYLKLRYVL